jgi:amidohydrolase
MTSRVRLTEFLPEMTAWRRDFHAHPEIGFEEQRTSAIVAAKLEEWGIEVHRGLGGTGVVGVLRGNRGGNRAIGLRADMDALPMQEANTFAHRSVNANRMHACGHDGHTTMLLGAAKYLAQTGNFSGTVHLIFQPAEEGLAGAKAMMDDGLFERFPCEAIYGIHNSPDMKLGTVRALTGTAMAAIDYFSVILRGRSAHAARPHQGIDTVAVAAQVISALNALPSRQIDALESAIVSIGQIHGGTSDIVIPETVELRGSVRTLKPQVQDQVEEFFMRAVQNTAAAFGAEAEINYRRAYPATINTEQETARAVTVASGIVGAENVFTEGKPTLAGEDFAFMLQRVPGAYLHFGQGDGARGTTPVHNPSYDFNDDLLPFGAAYLAGLVENELK